MCVFSLAILLDLGQYTALYSLLSWLFKMASGRAEWSNYLHSYISDIQGVNTKHCFLETKYG